MSYGIKITNQADEIIIDSEYPVMVLENETTLTGTPISGTPFYEYPFSAGGDLTFFDCTTTQANDGVMLLSNRVRSRQSSLAVRTAANIRDVHAPGGYGFETYDSSGNITYSANQSLFVVKGLAELSTSHEHGNWVCPLESRPRIQGNQFSSQPGTTYAHAYWFDAGQLNVDLIVLGAAPPGLHYDDPWYRAIVAG